MHNDRAWIILGGRQYGTSRLRRLLHHRTAGEDEAADCEGKSRTGIGRKFTHSKNPYFFGAIS
jgi:hypothetical protein